VVVVRALEEKERGRGWLVEEGFSWGRTVSLSAFCMRKMGEADGEVEGGESDGERERGNGAHTAPQLEQLFELPSELAPHLGQAAPCMFAIEAFEVLSFDKE
jgi:hypothetical protein